MFWRFAVVSWLCQSRLRGHRVQLTSTMQLGTTFHWLPGQICNLETKSKSYSCTRTPQLQTPALWIVLECFRKYSSPKLDVNRDFATCPICPPLLHFVLESVCWRKKSLVLFWTQTNAFLVYRLLDHSVMERM